MTKGFDNMPVRFFIWDECPGESKSDFIEATEAQFLEADGEIEYIRNTVFDNGVKQICLTKNPFSRC